MKPLLVIVSGPPGAGKTTLARRLAAEVELPVLVRDDLKESLFDTLGWRDREWSKQVGAATWELLFLLMEKLVAGGASAVVESNFDQRWHEQRLEEFARRYGVVLVEIHCTADVRILRDRFQARERHPGHNPEGVGSYTLDVAAAARRNHRPIGVGRLIEVDTTHPNRIDWEDLVTTVRRMKDGPEER